MTAPTAPRGSQAAVGDVTAGEPPSDRGSAVTAGPVDVQTHPPGFATPVDRTTKRTTKADARAIAYYTGAADARNRRPHRGNPGDVVYTRGYNDQHARADRG